MANPIKYSTGSETLALKKGNFYIGTGDVGKGPTSSTGYYNGITPPSGGYTIYLNKNSGDPSIYTASNDAQLISLTNSIAGTSYTTANECLSYFAGQTDKICFNRDYEGIVTDGLVLNLDAGFTPSYPKNGTTWYDVSGSNNGTLTNGPTFSSNDGGSIVFDGTNDYINIPYSGSTSGSFTFTITMKCDNMNSIGNNRQTLFGLSQNGNAAYQQFDIEIWGNQGRGFRGNGGGGEGTNFFRYNWDSNGDANSNNIYTITLNSTGHKIYLNGQLKNSINQAYTASFNSVVLGTRLVGNLWNGQCYYFSIYNRELSATEIQQNYNAQKGRFGL
jgi:hypothetical protein